MVKLYKDLGKTAKKLLNDDYIYGDKKVQLKTKTSNGMTYTTTAKQSGGDGSLAGELSCKYAVNGSTMTTKFFTSGKLTQEVELQKTGVKGLKLTLLGGLGPSQSLLTTAEYVHPHLSLVSAANLLGKQSVNAALTMGVHGVTAGVAGEFDLESKEIKNVDGAVNYSHGKEHEATAMLLKKGAQAKFAYSHIVTSDFSVAAEFLYDIKNDGKLLTMGSKYEVDPETTLKMKIDSAGAFSVSYIQEIRKQTTLTLCSRFDVRNLDKASHKFGLSLVVE